MNFSFLLKTKLRRNNRLGGLKGAKYVGFGPKNDQSGNPGSRHDFARVSCD